MNPQVNNRHDWASPIYLLEPQWMFEQASRVAEIWHDSFPESVDVFSEVLEIIQRRMRVCLSFKGERFSTIEPDLIHREMLTKEVAKLLRKSEDWIMRQARRELIPSFKIGSTRLFRMEDGARYLESTRIGPKYESSSEESATVMLVGSKRQVQ